jgi:hypothetical protein
MQSHMGNAPAVVGDHAFAAAGYRGPFDKLVVGVPERRDVVFGLFHHAVMVAFFETHGFKI